MAVFGNMVNKDNEVSLDDIMVISCEAANDVMMEVISSRFSIALESGERDDNKDGLLKKFKEFIKKMKTLVAVFFKKMELKIKQKMGRTIEDIKKNEQEYRKMKVPKNFTYRAFPVKISNMLVKIIDRIGDFIHDDVENMIKTIPIDNVSESSLLEYYTGGKAKSLKATNDIIKMELLGNKENITITNLNTIIDVVVKDVVDNSKAYLKNVNGVMTDLMDSAEKVVGDYSGDDRGKIVTYYTQVVNLSMNIFNSITQHSIETNELLVDQYVDMLHKLKRAQ